MQFSIYSSARRYKFSYIAALSIHAISCCWFAISCKNEAMFGEDSPESLCKADCWVASLEGEDSYYSMIINFVGIVY